MMMTYEDTKYVSLNSQQGISRNTDGTYVKSYLSHIDFNFPNLLKEETDILYNHIDIVNAQFPVSFYNINYTSNTLKYTVNNSNIQTLTIPVGNYSIISLKSILISQFLIAGYVFTITFNESTNKYTFTNSLYDFSFLSSGSTILETIGFDSVYSYVSTTKSLISEHSASLLGIKKIKVSSKALSTNSISSGGGVDILSTIPVNGIPRGIILYNNTGNRKSLLKNRIIDSIDIILKDELNNYINWNNVEWSLTLAITTTRIYKNSILSLASLFSNNKNQNQNQNDGLIETERSQLPFDNENDLDFYMYQKGYNTG
jgi:hypothetical protein